MVKRSLLALSIAAAGGAKTLLTQDLHLRLETPLASYSRPGTPFTARVFGSFERDALPVLPAGTLIRGIVRRAHSIGLGLRLERSGLTLQFESCQLPGGETVACDVQLLAVDNARETVHPNNRIRGALAASHPASRMSGLWYRPGTDLLLRPASGLAGAGGMLASRFAPGPAGAAIFVVSRLIFFRMPDPEIELPAGTDLIARVGTADRLAGAPAPLAPVPAAEFPDGFPEWLANVPGETTRTDGALAADTINMAFLGSESELASAFAAAGWHGADPLTARTFARTYSAFAGMRTYSRAPVSMLHHEGRPPDLVFQKSFNTLSRRHHIRLWQRELPGLGVVWLGAATHDVAIIFDWNRLNLTHRIDTHTDRERSKVVNDLSAMGCVDGALAIQRISELRRNPQSEQVVSDGAIWAGRLRECRASDPAGPLGLSKPQRSRAALTLRRAVLETRQYLTRANPYHLAYQSVRRPISGPKGTGKPETYAMAFK